MADRVSGGHVVSAFVVLGAALALVGASARAAARGDEPGPLVGANYTELAQTGTCGRRYIVRHGHEPGARRAMRLQLAAMRAAGIESLRFFIWHDHDGAAFETIPSAGGRLVEPYRSNFVAYLQAARELGFKGLEIVFGPVLANDPMAIYGGIPYDPALFDENWSLIQDVRALAKENGPPSRFDLLNEGAPSDGQVLKSQIIGYIARLYRAYVDAFGNDDVTVSTIYQQIDPTRLPNLLTAFRASGRAMPTYFEVHPDYIADWAIRDLKDVDAGLAAAGLRQPLVVGEAPYDDLPVAAAVRAFLDQSQREVTDVLEWPLESTSACRGFSVAPPYRASAYIEKLRGKSALAGTYLLSGSVSSTGVASLQTGGLPVTALEDGIYRVRVDDRSSRAGFALAGPGLARSTAARFRGARLWKVMLKPGVYRYGSSAGRSSFTVLRSRGGPR